MIDPATKAREAASHCEGKLHAFRKTQDGVVVSFVLHPQEVPASLQLAPLGTRYVLALVELGDDELPKQEGTIAAATANGTQQQPAPGHTSHSVQTPVRANPEKRLTRQAAICCNDPLFQSFLFEHGMAIEKTAECAKTAIYLICSVQSRKEIIPGTPAARCWDDLYGRFLAWKVAA